MGVVFVVIFILFVLSTCFYFIKGRWESPLLGFAILFFLMLICICTFLFFNIGPIAEQNLREKTEANYERLVQLRDNSAEIDAELLEEIDAYNTEIKTKRESQKDILRWGLFPFIYEEFKLIAVS